MSEGVLSRVGQTRIKSNNDDKHDHGLEKRRPSTLCGGKENDMATLTLHAYNWIKGPTTSNYIFHTPPQKKQKKKKN